MGKLEDSIRFIREEVPLWGPGVTGDFRVCNRHYAILRHEFYTGTRQVRRSDLATARLVTKRSLLYGIGMRGDFPEELFGPGIPYELVTDFRKYVLLRATISPVYPKEPHWFARAHFPNIANKWGETIKQLERAHALKSVMGLGYMTAKRSEEFELVNAMAHRATAVTFHNRFWPRLAEACALDAVGELPLDFAFTSLDPYVDFPGGNLGSMYTLPGDDTSRIYPGVAALVFRVALHVAYWGYPSEKQHAGG